MTDEKLEKQISEEFEKYWYKPLHDSMNSDGKFDKDLFRYKDLGKQSAQLAYKAAALPLMKKIEEMEKENKFQADVMCDMGEVVLENKKLQKENEELREALDWLCHEFIPSKVYQESKMKEIRTKFNLDKEGGK